MVEDRSDGPLARLVPWVLLLTACATSVKKPEITVERITHDLTDKATGKTRAASLGSATLRDVKLVKSSVQGNESWPVVDVKAEQRLIGETHTLSARLELHYAWSGRDWQLRETRELRKWIDLTARAQQPRPEPGAQDTDSSAIEQLLRAKRAAQRNLGGIPVIPW